MCGIAGIFDNQHHLENQQVLFKQMIHSMKHRGPNDEGIYLKKPVVLMHTRLAVVDIEKGKQPMQIGPYTIVYNGECYNTSELKEDLIARGAVFTTQSDTEVLLMAYMYDQEKCLEKIRGIFSFAIYNEENQSLFLARDPMGVKPLFYTFVGKTFLFASEIKTLLTYPLVQPILTLEGIHQIAYLGPGRISGNGVFKDIYELKGGEYATLDATSFEKKSYFTIAKRLHQDDDKKTAQEVKSKVIQSIQRQLVSDVPLGAFLSGGLDSSIICAVAAKQFEKEGKQLKTFSLEFEENDLYFIPNHFQPSGDTYYVDLMVKTFKTLHTKITLKSSDLLNALYKAVDARDLPGMADIDAALLCFCEKVKKEVDVVLSGECADEIFGGYPWFHDPKTVSFPWTQNLQFRHTLLNKKYQRDCLSYTQALIHDSFNRAIFHEKDSEEERQKKQMTFLNLEWFMQTLLDRKDRMSMSSGLEARVPFCDVDLLNYVYSIPWEIKSKNKEKGILREAMQDLLPEEILNRKKNPFPKTHHPQYLATLRNELSKLSSEDPLFVIFNRQEIMKMCESESPIPWYGQLMTTPQTIAYFLQISYWLKKYKVQIQDTQECCII